MVLELVTGGELFDYIVEYEGKGIGEEKAKHIFSQIAKAVHYLHLKGFHSPFFLFPLHFFFFFFLLFSFFLFFFLSFSFFFISFSFFSFLLHFLLFFFFHTFFFLSGIAHRDLKPENVCSKPFTFLLCYFL